MKVSINNISINGRRLLATALVACAGTAFVGARELRGRIVDPDGTPVPGAVVNVAEQSRIVLSDKDGCFTLRDVSYDDEVNTRCIGYITTIVPVEDLDRELVITLVPDRDLHSHPFQVGFGSKQDKFTTEATSTVTGSELQRYPVTVLQNAFNSTLTGVTTYEAASEPGWAETTMYVRGIRTLNSNARNPIIIVDNVERDISFLDAFPIETVTVLKDAAATAIYGMRGANGVILITTKRGQSGKTNIDFTQEVGFQTLTGKVETQNSYNMALTRNQVRYLSGQDPMYTPEQIEMYRRVCAGEQLEGMDRYRYFNTNWFDQLYRETSPVVRTNLQISGGNNRARYYVSFSYLRQEGMWNDRWTSYNERFNTQHVLNRWNLRTNLDINVSKYLTVGLDLGGRIDNIIQPTEGVFGLTTFGAVEANPMEPVFTPQGYIYSSSTATNPARQLAASGQEKNRRRQLYSTLNINGDLSVLAKGLGVEAVISFDAYDGFESTQRNAINTYSYDYMNMNAQKIEDFTLTQTTTYSELTNPTANERDNAWTLNLRGGLKYNRVFGKHNIDVHAFVRSYMRRLNVGPHSADNTMYSSDRSLSYNAMATYVFDNRYVLNGSISRMGNDNFDPGSRWGTFWAASAGWLLNNEKFLRNENIDLLKLRASYGETGFDATGAGRYPYQSTYREDGGYGFGYNAVWVPGYIENVAGNPNSKWEVSKMFNAGLDWDFWHRKLYGSFDVWKEWRSNILVSRSTIPDMIGIGYAQDSYGKVESRGIELTVGTQQKIGRVSFQIEGLLSWNTNRITEMDETEPLAEWLRKTGSRIRGDEHIGDIYDGDKRGPVGGWYIYQFEHWASDPNLVATSHQDAIDHPEKYPYNVNSAGNQQLGTAVFRDVNGDRQINELDRVPTKYTMLPDLTPSLLVGVKYAGFDLRAVLTAYLNRQVFLSPMISFSGWSIMGTHEVTKAWGYYNDNPADPCNINATYPRPMYGGFNNIDSHYDGSYKNDIWVKNGNYLSLRNIEFGYSLPEKLIAKAYMTRCRVYFNAYNVFNWSSLPKGMDPEKPISFVWWYPKTRIFSFGVNVSF